MKQIRKTSNVQIDVDYLNEAIKASGKTIKEIAASIGRTYSFIRNATVRGQMQRPAAELLCNIHGFDINQLCPKPVEESSFTLEPVQQEEAKVLMSDDETLKAFVEALNRVEKKCDHLEAKLNHVIKYIKAM